MVDEEEGERRVARLTRTIAIHAMGLPPRLRPVYIRQAVDRICSDHEQEYRRDPLDIAAANMLMEEVEALMKTIEESGGTIGNA